MPFCKFNCTNVCLFSMSKLNMSKSENIAEEKATKIIMNEYCNMAHHILFRDIKCELISEGLLTIQQKSRIQSILCNEDQMLQLIDLLLRSHLRKTLPVFVEVLSKCGYTHIAKKLQHAVTLIVRAFRRSSCMLEEFQERLNLMRELDTADLVNSCDDDNKLRRQMSKNLQIGKANNSIQDTIIRCWALLCNDVLFEDISDYVFSKKIITQTQKQYICCEKSNRDQMDSFLLNLTNSDLPYTYPIFMGILDQLGEENPPYKCVREELLHVNIYLKKQQSEGES